MKKIISLLLILSVILPCTLVYGESEGPINTYTLSLSDAIAMAKEYSPELECMEVNKKNYKIQLGDAMRKKNQNKNTPVNINTSYELVFVKNGYYVEAANSRIRLSEIEERKIENTISYNTTQKYYTVKNAAKMCDIASSALQRAKENYLVCQNKYDMGAATKLELENADIAVMQCEATLEKAKNAYELSAETLKIALGIDGECVLNLTDEISVTAFDADYNADTKSALNSRYDINALKESADLAVLYFKSASALSSQSATYFSAYTNQITSKYNFNTGAKNIALLVKSAYYAVLEAKSNSDIALKKYEYAKNNYDVNKVRYEMGMITGMMLSASSDELASAQSNYENALLTEKLASEKYNYEIDTGI